uniref:Regulator of rDNA transcription protein 15 n=1 Tax=Salix viminalis TaxID=40686 RepID=A0A6N2MFF4_SALVM
MTPILWEASQKYDGFYWTDNVYKAFHYHNKMREKTAARCCAGASGWHQPRLASIARGAGRPVPRGGWHARPARGLARLPAGGWHALPARGLARLAREGAGTPGPRGGWHAWPARGLARLAREGAWHAWPAGGCTPGPRGAGTPGPSGAGTPARAGAGTPAPRGGWHAWPARGLGRLSREGAGTPGPRGALARLAREGGTPVPRGGLARLARAGGWQAWPARGAGTPARAGGWHDWPARGLARQARAGAGTPPARGAGTPAPRGGLARLPREGAGTPGPRGGLARLSRAGRWHAWPARGAGTPGPRGAGTPGPRGGLARLARAGAGTPGPRGGCRASSPMAATGLVLVETLLGAQKYDGFYWFDRVWKASRYHCDMREPQQLAYRSGGVGLAPRTVPRGRGLAGPRAPGSSPQPQGGAGPGAEFPSRLPFPAGITVLRTDHAYRPATARSQIWTWLVQRCYSRPLAPPSRVKFMGQRVERCARGLDGRATRRAVAAGHPEQRCTLSPMNLFCFATSESPSSKPRVRAMLEPMTFLNQYTVPNSVTAESSWHCLRCHHGEIAAMIKTRSNPLSKPRAHAMTCMNQKRAAEFTGIAFAAETADTAESAAIALFDPVTAGLYSRRATARAPPSPRVPGPGNSRPSLREAVLLEGLGGTNRSDMGLNLSGSWQQGHSATYNTPSRGPRGSSTARAWPTARASGAKRPLLQVGNRTAGARVASSPDSDLEAFSHNPTHGSFAPLAFQPSAMTNSHVPYWWVNNPTLGEFCFTMIGRADIEGSKSNVAMNAWLPQASYPCGNFSDTSSFKFRRSKGSIGHAFTVRIRTGNQNQTSFYPFVPHEISVLVELILGHLRYLLTDVPPQPNSPPDNVFRPDRPPKRPWVQKEGQRPASDSRNK